MPSQRKRIGFLPRAEVQDIINEIAKDNKLSQSKVTGILVEEALSHRRIFNGKAKSKQNFKIKNSFLIENESFIYESENQNDNFNLDENYIKDELQMIDDFIEFKFFKSIMRKKVR